MRNWPIAILISCLGLDMKWVIKDNPSSQDYAKIVKVFLRCILEDGDKIKIDETLLATYAFER